MQFKYLSVSSAGLGIFSFCGFISTCYNLNPLFFDKLEGVIGCSAGAVISLMIALKSYKNNDIFIKIMQKCAYTTIETTRRSFSLGWQTDNVGKYISSDLAEVVSMILEASGFSQNVRFEDIQRHLPIRLVFVVSNLNNLQPVYMTSESHGELTIIEIIQMSSAVPFLTPPIKYRDMLAADGGIIEHINTTYYPSHETFYLMSGRLPVPYTQKADIFSYMTSLISGLQIQQDMLFQKLMKHHNHVRIGTVDMMNCVDVSKEQMQFIIEESYGIGCAKALSYFKPDCVTACVTLSLYLSKHESSSYIFTG